MPNTRPTALQRGLNLLLALMLLLPAQLATLFGRPSVAAAVPVVAERSVPPAFEATPAGDTAEVGQTSLPSEWAGQREIPAARTLHTAAYELDDGRIAVVQDPRPLNYQDAAGRWQPVDPTFDAVEGGWINTRNTLKTSVAQTGSQARISLENVGVGWEPQALQLVDAAGEPLRTVAEPLPTGEALAGIRSEDSRTIRYPKSWDAPGLEETWQLAAGSAAYSLRLAEQPALDPLLAWSPWHTPRWLELRVMLHLKPGTTVHVAGKPVALPLETTDVVTFVDAGGETLLLQPPAVFEEADPAQNRAGRYLLRRGSAPDTIDLRVRFDWDWLAATGRSYPVILDPVFQTLSPITMKLAAYTVAGGFDRNYVPATLGIGSFSDGITRGLLHFAMPVMPPGTQIDRAFLVAAPYDTVEGDDFYAADMQLFPLADSNWLASNTAPPAPSGGALPYFAGNPMRYSAGSPLKLPTVWDVTALAAGWQTNPASNHGLMLKMATECPRLIFLYCNGFYFEYPSKFSDEELRLTETVSDPTISRLWTFSSNSGIRLVTFYRGPALGEGERKEADPPSVDGKYYHADHVYNLPALPGKWQAVAVRGINYRESEGNTYAELRNTPPLEVRSRSNVLAADAEAAEQPAIAGPNTLPVVLAPVFKGILVDDQVINYVALNGRNFPGGVYEARVRPLVGGSPDKPEFYDVQLIGEESQSLNITTFGANTFTVNYSSIEPLKIWNLNLPAGSNNRIDFLYGVGDPVSAYDFSAQLFQGNSQAILSQGNRQQSKQFQRSGFTRLASEIFRADTTNYGLVLAYNAAYTPSFPGGENGPRQYTIQMRVTSCAAGSFPTGGGECQKVDCPTPAFPAANFQTNVGLGVWSATGWSQPPNSSSKITVKGAVAPLVGGPSMSNAPKVAVIGGQVELVPNSFSRVIKEANDYLPDVLLIDCQPGVATFSSYLQAFRGELSTTTHPSGQTVLSSGVLGAQLFYSPWLDVESFTLKENFFVAPIAGRLGGYGTLDRVIGPGGAANKFTFLTDWSIGPQGWSTLTSSALRGASGTVPTVASLSVDLGLNFVFDFDAVQQKFVALRGRAARITQPAQLGGASKPVQVLIFPRTLPIPTDPPRLCGYDNCLDVRSVRDTPANPDRAWQMPDVHVTGEAGMVAVSSAGVLQVYSRDFPDELRKPADAGDTVLASMVNAPAATNDFNANFSYDTFGAKVAVRKGKCVEEDTTEVDIIEGATYVSLPSIGSSGGADARIGSSFKLCQSTLRRVHMEFQTPVGVPLGNSGLFLTGLEGTVDIYPGHTTITFGLDIQAAPGGDGGILKMHGKVTIDTRGLFAFQGQGSVLKGIVGIDGALWVAWNPLDIGFRVSMGYPLKNPWISGMLRAHLWKGQGFANRYAWLPDNDETHIAAQASVTILIKKGAAFSWWFIDIPPSDIHFGIEIAFGQFCTNGPCTQYEWGIKGKFTVVGYDVGLYYTFGRDLTSPEVNPANLSFILGNDSHVLIDQYNGATDVPVMAAQAYTPDALDEVVSVYRSPNAIDAEDDFIPFTVSPNAKQLLFGLGWQAGAPQLTLLPPGGGEITPQNAAANGAQFQTSLQSTLVSVQNPAAGEWRARISNLSEDGIEHYQFTYFASKGAPLAEGENIFLTPAAPSEQGTDHYRITWRVPAGATDEATISLYATRVADDRLGNTEEAVPIAQNLPLKQGAFDWNLTSFPFGDYAISGQVDDGINAAPPTASEDLCDVNFNPLPTRRAFDSRRFAITHVFTATGTIQPNDPGFPDAPANLVLTPLDSAFLARWTPATDPTVTAYQVHVQWSPTEWRDYTVLAGPTPSLRVGALENDIEYQVTVTAQDVEGKTSDSIFGIVMPQLGSGELPDPPTDLAVTSTGSGSAVLTWQPAPDTTPAGYRVHYVRVGRVIERGQMDTTTPGATLTGLQAGATYDVQVSALHSEGWESDRSAAVRLVATGNADADGDGLPDDWATLYGVSGANNDPDGDGLTNRQEYELGTDPTRQNSDGDAFSDAEEVAAETDPLDATSYGAIFTQPRLTLGQDRLVFRTKLQTAGEVAPSATISWTNTGGGNLALAATSSAGWLNAQVVGNDVRITTTPQGLAPGQYTGVVRLAPAAGSDPLIGPAACIRVQLWASPPDVGGNEFPYQIKLPLINNGGTTATSGLLVYGDALAAGWEDWSWDSTVNLNETGRVQSGASAIAVTYNAAFAGFSVRAPQAINTANYMAIRFWVYGSGGGNPLLLYTEGGDSGPLSSQHAFTAPPNTWTQITVPLSALGNPAAIKRINVQENGGGAQPTFFLDELQLVGR